MKPQTTIDQEIKLANKKIALEINQKSLINLGEELYSLKGKKMNGTIQRSLNRCDREISERTTQIAKLQKEIQHKEEVLKEEEKNRLFNEKCQEREEYHAMEKLFNQYPVIRQTIINCVNDPYMNMQSTKIASLKGEHDKIFQITGGVEFRMDGQTLKICKNDYPNLLRGPKYITKEHPDGRTNVIIYFYREIELGNIKTVEDAIKWIHQYGVWIYTSAKFNEYVKKFQNDNNILITAEIYVKCYEDFYHVKLSLEEIEKMKHYFLSNTYGTEKFTQEDLINLIIANNKPVKPISKFQQIIKILFK